MVNIKEFPLKSNQKHLDLMCFPLNVPTASYNFTWNKLVGVVHINARACVKEIKAGEKDLAWQLNDVSSLRDKKPMRSLSG